MISGEAPFDAESEEELMDIISGDDPIEYPPFFSDNAVDVCVFPAAQSPPSPLCFASGRPFFKLRPLAAYWAPK